MEGTSGAADRAPFREGAREAALTAKTVKAGFARRLAEASS